MFVVDAQLREFIESGVAVLIATGNRAGRPHLRYGWGPRVDADGTTVSVFIEEPRATLILEDISQVARIAMTVADPVTYRSIQLKGPVLGTLAATDDEHDRVRRHREAFMTSTALVGDDQEVIRNTWMEAPLVRIDFRVEQAYNQTPGAEAGQPL